MPYKSELEFERDFVNFLQQNCGWKDGVIKYPTEEDLINNWSQIIFENNKNVGCLNNCRLTPGEIDQIMSQVKECKTPASANNFINGKTVTITRDNQDDTLNFGKAVSLKIFDRNEIAAGSTRYQIVEQPRFRTDNEIYPNERGDIMLLINGIPVYHIELKKSGVSIARAEEQIKKYMHNKVFTGIFSLVQIFVAMNPEEAVYFANPGSEEYFNPMFYFHWTDTNNEYINNWDKFSHSLLMIPRAHEMIGFYTVADLSDGILKVLRPYQVYAANCIIRKISASHWVKSDQKGGYVWHTTGSGKTLTSFKTAQLIANLQRDVDKVVFLIDRVELGEQSFEDYKNFASFDVSVSDTKNTNELINLLVGNSSVTSNDSKIIITSIQKMSRINENNVSQTILNKVRQKKIVFIIDECHRDNSGEMHQVIEHTFPNAMFFGFTGTPDLEKTKEIFGNELHRYTIAFGIRDKNVLGFDPYRILIYPDKDMRKKVALRIIDKPSEKDAIADPKTNSIYRYFLNKSDKSCLMTEIEEHVPKIQYETDEYRKFVVQEIIDNWCIRSLNSKFHAIFATSSIKDAILYYKIFKQNELNHSHDLKITAIFDPSDNNNDDSILKIDGITEILTDYNEMFNKTYNISSYSEFKKDVCLRLRHKDRYRSLKTDQQLNIVIVVDQLLTGFDSKWINTLYLDKVLQGKNFVQAASRTNRLYGDEKSHGTIIWYRYPYTTEQYFYDAIGEYSGDAKNGVFVNKLKDNLESLNNLYKEIKDLFELAKINNFSKNDNDQGWQKKFSKLFSEFNKILNSAKLQGFNWSETSYDFIKSEGVQEKVDINFTYNEYMILVIRYKELLPARTSGKGYEPPFDINPSIFEMKTDMVNIDYMDSRFKQYLKCLKTENKDIQNSLNELHKSFSLLTTEDQSFARQILSDIENGSFIYYETKNLSDYINDYKANKYNDEVHKISQGLGLDFDKLNCMINLHLTSININEFNRFDDLKSDVDIDKSRIFLEHRFTTTLPKNRDVKMKVDEFLRDIIINGIQLISIDT